MDRHICRAKRKDNKQWVQGYYACLNDTTYCFKEDYEMHPDNTKHYIIVDEMTDWCLPNEHKLIEVIHETVCQFTGLTDKNGTKIFEHDYVRTTYDRICEVVWFESPAYVGLDLVPVLNFDKPAPDRFDLWRSKNLEVYGNKFSFEEI